MATSTSDTTFGLLQDSFNRFYTSPVLRKEYLMLFNKNIPNALALLATIIVLGALIDELYLNGEQVHLDGEEITLN